MSPTHAPHSPAISATCVVFPLYQTQVVCRFGFQGGGRKSRTEELEKRFWGGGGGSGSGVWSMECEPKPKSWRKSPPCRPEPWQPAQGGKGLFINSQTRPLHANEGNQTTRKGISPCTAYPSASSYIIPRENICRTT